VLKRRADIRALAFVLFSIGVQAVGFVLLPESWAMKLLLCVAGCQTSFICAVISHNTLHCPMFTRRWMNRGVQFLLTIGQGDPVSSFVPGHNLGHHTHLQGPKDTMRTSKMRFRWNLLNQALFMFVIGGDLLKHTYRYVWSMRHRRRAWFLQFLAEGALLYGTYAALLVVYGVEPFLLYAFIPHVFSSWGIIGINFVQHDGCDTDHPVNHSRNFVGKLLNWWTFNNGYHGIHHMHPGLHWSLLPEAHARELSPTIHPALEQPSLLAYCWRAYGWPGRRVTFDGKPLVLPPPIPDESWVPTVSEMADVSLGAEG
jgi:fatty acid desaturase